MLYKDLALLKSIVLGKMEEKRGCPAAKWMDLESVAMYTQFEDLKNQVGDRLSCREKPFIVMNIGVCIYIFIFRIRSFMQKRDIISQINQRHEIKKKRGHN